jgi:hypothetical protein
MHRIALASAVLTCLASPVAAQAPRPCAPDPAIPDRLASEYGEAVTGGGIDAAGRLLRIFANLETGTWTAVVSTAEGISCVVSSGESWSGGRAAPVTPGRSS